MNRGLRYKLHRKKIAQGSFEQGLGEVVNLFKENINETNRLFDLIDIRKISSIYENEDEAVQREILQRLADIANEFDSANSKLRATVFVHQNY